MRIPLIASFLLVFLFTACAAPTATAPAPTATAVEVTVTSQVTFTSTAPATPTPEATATPEAPEVKMTLEDWKKVLYSATFIGRYDNQKYSTEEIFGPSESEILTDPDIIKEIKAYNPIVILHPSGLITVITDPIRAAEIVKKEKDAFVITMIDKTIASPCLYSKYAVMVASNAYRNGVKNIHVEFGEITTEQFVYPQSTPIDISLIYIITEPDGRVITPIMDMPIHFKIARGPLGGWDFVSPEEAGLDNLDQVYWLDQIIKAGFDVINIYPQ